MRMPFLDALKARAKELKRYTLVAYYAARDPRTPWFVRGLALFVAAYALSPVDLIPDFIPILGHLDDLVLVPLGVALVIRLLPAPVLASARDQARVGADRPTGRRAAAVVVGIWLLLLCVFGRWAYTAMRR